MRHASRLLRTLVVGGLAACGPRFYAPCEADGDCSDVVPEGKAGECVDSGGVAFCAWQCVTDSDCDGDRDDRYAFVCAPFESSPGTYCFPSCDDEDDDQGDDGSDACPHGFGCRSTGGGSDNEKVCFPDG